MKAEKGSKELKSLLDANNNEESVIEIDQQALYEEEVDHHIEEVGIMAIREVRYVTEREWQKMIEMQKNQEEIMKYLDQISRFEKRHVIASTIPRNNRGRFVSKAETPKQKPIKPAGRRGRPRKQANQ